MAEVSLPQGVDFEKKLGFVPNSFTSQLLTIQPNSGINSYSPGSVITFDFPSRQDLYLDGATLFFRCRLSAVSGATAAVVVGIPAYSWIQKLDEFSGSVPLSSVYNYHQCAHLFVNTNYSIADKYGAQSAFGFTTAGATNPDMESFTLTASTTNLLPVSAPLVCSAIQSGEKLWPTGLHPPLRIQLTVASIADFVTVPANLTSYTVQNIELCIQAIQMPGVDALVAQMAPKLYQKITCWSNSGNGVSAATSGVQNLIFNARYKSIENLYLLSNSTDKAVDLNGVMDSRDVTSGGTYQFQIGSSLYPQLPIDASANRAGVLMYLKECTGSIADNRNSMSINKVEFSYVGSGGASTATEPGKFIVGCPLTRVSQRNPYASSSLLSGVDAQSTPITAILRIATATGSAHNVNLIAQYTGLVELDPRMPSMVNVIA